MKKLCIAIGLISLVLFYVVPLALAECEGDFDNSGAVDGSDLATFASEYGTIDRGQAADEYPAPVAQTGQIIDYAARDDGDLEMGVEWPEPRFEENTDGTITDHLTGLIWLKNANCTVFFSGDGTGQNARAWQHALTAANSLSSGFCGLSEGSISGDWRLPNIKELHSLINFGNYNPALPSGHPFTGVQWAHYWSATTIAPHTQNAWYVYMENGVAAYRVKTNASYVWPVRSGE